MAEREDLTDYDLNFLRERRKADFFYLRGKESDMPSAIINLKERGYITLEKDVNDEGLYNSVLTSKGLKALSRYQHKKRNTNKKTNLIPRATAFIFFISGLTFAVMSDFSSTGRVVASSGTSIAQLPAFLSILLAGIGGFLFVRSK